MTFEEYKTAMFASDPCIKEMLEFRDGECLIVKRLLYHFTLIRSVIGNMDGYEDRYCYATQEGASIAAYMWISLGSDEPTGWHRHPPTGRRRTGGDPATEYIEW